MDGNLSIADVLALQRDGRNYDYDGGYCRRGGRGMAATGIGLGAGLGGAALIGVFLAAWGINQASKARLRAAENASSGNTKAIEIISSRLLQDSAQAATFNLDVTQSLRSLNGATGGASTSTASALAQAEALAMLMNGGTTGRNSGQVCPTPVALYQPAMPCSCNTCGN